MNDLRPGRQGLFILIVLLTGAAGAWALVAKRPQLSPNAVAQEAPLVEVMQAQPQSMRLNVRSQGVVAPRTRINLGAEIGGTIVALHSGMVAGGFFEQGDVLVRIDPRDYDFAIAEAQAKVAEAERQLAMEQAESEQAKVEWLALGGGEASPLTLRQPQLVEARAKLRAAKAELAKARLQRSRCELKAPFAGRVETKSIGLGQYVRPGDKLAQLYSIDAAEVRLPITVEQLGYLDMPMTRVTRDDGPLVVLKAAIGGVEQRWEGRIVRSESAIDETTGLLYLVAEVREPYDRRFPQPLLAGLFVEAEIEGRQRNGVFVLPPTAVNFSQQTLLVDSRQQLRIKRLDVLRNEGDRVLIKGGLNAGDRIVLSAVAVPVEGMHVRINDNASANAGAENISTMKNGELK